MPITFFPRILEQLIGFHFQIFQRRLRLLLFRTGLQFVTNLIHGDANNAKLPCQLCGWFPLLDTLQKQDGLLGTKLTTFKDHAAVHIVNATKCFTAIDRQLTAFRLAKPLRLGHFGLTMRIHPCGWKYASSQRKLASRSISSVIGKSIVHIVSKSLLLNMSQDLYTLNNKFYNARNILLAMQLATRASK